MGEISPKDGFKSWQGLTIYQVAGIKGDKMAVQQSHEEALWELAANLFSLPMGLLLINIILKITNISITLLESKVN